MTYMYVYIHGWEVVTEWRLDMHLLRLGATISYKLGVKFTAMKLDMRTLRLVHCLSLSLSAYFCRKCSCDRLISTIKWSRSGYVFQTYMA